MIPRDYITEWRPHAPWAEDAQVEQDLVISRALVELFSDPVLGERLAFRGGTALHKLFLRPPARYSEDIDVVQVRPVPIGEDLSRIRSILGTWLEEGRWKQTDGGATLTFRFDSEEEPSRPLRLKVEINTREHGTRLGYHFEELVVASRWFSGRATIRSFKSRIRSGHAPPEPEGLQQLRAHRSQLTRRGLPPSRVTGAPPARAP